MKKREIPAWPETLRVVAEEWRWGADSAIMRFTVLQSGEEPPPDVLGMATYHLDKPERKKRRKRP